MPLSSLFLFSMGATGWPAAAFPFRAGVTVPNESMAAMLLVGERVGGGVEAGSSFSPLMSSRGRSGPGSLSKGSAGMVVVGEGVGGGVEPDSPSSSSLVGSSAAAGAAAVFFFRTRLTFFLSLDSEEERTWYWGDEEGGEPDSSFPPLEGLSGCSGEEERSSG